MTKGNYKRLGEYIEPIDIRNRNLRNLPLSGVSVEKNLIPSVANTNGTDFTKYKILGIKEFVYIADTSRRGDKIAFALNNKDTDVLVSSAYTTFRIKDENELLPEYLMMWAKRPEFDRYARYMSHGSVREIFSWEDMCNVMLPVPPISEQRRIVNEYQTVERRIANNEALIQKLEETAQAIYHHTFVEGIDEEKLPEGWRMGTFGEIMDISSGKSLSNKSDYKNNTYKYPVAGASGIIGYSLEYNKSTRILTTGRVGTLGVINKYSTPIWAADNVLVIESKFYEFSYNLLKTVNYEEIAKGGVQALLTQTELKNYPTLIPSEFELLEFETEVKPFYQFIDNLKQETHHLRTLLTLLTSKLS